MKIKECTIGHASLITPLGNGLDVNTTAILNDQSFYQLLTPETFGADFPVAHAGIIPPEFYEGHLHPDLTKAEKILNTLIKDYLAKKNQTKIDAFFLLYKNINTFEYFNSGSAFTFQDDRSSVASLLKRNGLTLAEENIVIIDNTCSTGLTLMTHAAQGIELGLWENVLVCTIDLITPYVMFILNGLGAFAGSEFPSEEASRPFDRKRSGFVKTESGSLALISLKPQHQQHDLMKIKSYCQTNDAYRLTDGRDDCHYIKKSMEQAIKLADVNQAELAFIKTHGTGTKLNDEHEAKAIIELFGHNIPVTSLKGHLGHTTDASGLIENLLAANVLKKNLIIPTKNCSDPEFDLNLILGKPKAASSRLFLSNSFGFGGTNASAIIEVV